MRFERTNTHALWVRETRFNEQVERTSERTTERWNEWANERMSRPNETEPVWVFLMVPMRYTNTVRSTNCVDYVDFCISVTCKILLLFFFFFVCFVDFFVFTLLIYLASKPNRSATAAVAVATTMANCKLSQTHVENWSSKSKAAKEQHYVCVCARVRARRRESGASQRQPTAWKCEQLHEYWATIQYKHIYTDISICIWLGKYYVCMFILS